MAADVGGNMSLHQAFPEDITLFGTGRKTVGQVFLVIVNEICGGMPEHKYERTCGFCQLSIDPCLVHGFFPLCAM
jgi:hypothetical protein